MTNNNYLYNQLVEINKKYESTSFVDIDIIDLFNIRSIDINDIKKIITNRYYSLALKYHPDKYNTDEKIIDIANISIIIEEIQSGQFLSFITEIYKILINMLKEDKDNLIRIINGGELIDLNFGGDHSSLKQHFNNKQIIINTEEINNLKDVIIDTKIDTTELDNMIINEGTKRNQLQIENIFIDDDIKAVGFKSKFNDKFISTISIDGETNIQKEIVPFNEINTNQKLITSRLTTSISDISEAFQTIKINRNIQYQSMSYDELITKRELESNSFKVAKNLKKESNFSVD